MEKLHSNFYFDYEYGALLNERQIGFSVFFQDHERDIYAQTTPQNLHIVSLS